MVLETAEITRILGLAKASLAAADSVRPILSCFCFDRDIAYAYNDVTATIVPFDSGLKCAVDGAFLSGVLGARLSGGQVEIDANKEGTAINLRFKGAKASQSKVMLPTLPKADFAFQYPDEEPKAELPLTEDLVRAITLCLISTTDDNLVPEFAGVTLQITKAGTVLYSTDNVSAGRVFIPGKQKTAWAGVIPTQAAQQLVKLAAACKLNDATLTLNESSLICGFEGATLVSKTLPAKPERYEAVFAQHADKIEYTAIPPGLSEELALAEVVLSKEQLKHCFLAFDGKNVQITAVSALGAVDAKLPAPGLTGRVNIPPGLFARVATDGPSEMSVNDRRALILRGGEFTHIISSAHIPEDTA